MEWKSWDDFSCDDLGLFPPSFTNDCADYNPDEFELEVDSDFDLFASYPSRPSPTSTRGYSPHVLPTNPPTPQPNTPPNRSRKKKAPTLREIDWEPYKKRIIQLLQEKRTLKEIKLTIEAEYNGFRAE